MLKPWRRQLRLDLKSASCLSAPSVKYLAVCHARRWLRSNGSNCLHAPPTFRTGILVGDVLHSCQQCSAVQTFSKAYALAHSLRLLACAVVPHPFPSVRCLPLGISLATGWPGLKTQVQAQKKQHLENPPSSTSGTTRQLHHTSCPTHAVCRASCRRCWIPQAAHMSVAESTSLPSWTARLRNPWFWISNRINIVVGYPLRALWMTRGCFIRFLHSAPVSGQQTSELCLCQESLPSAVARLLAMC